MKRCALVSIGRVVTAGPALAQADDRQPFSENKVTAGFNDPMYLIVNLAMGSKTFEGVGFVDGLSPATVAFEIDRISAYPIDER